MKDYKKEAIKIAVISLIVGVVVILLGVLFTWISYNAAGPSGRYVIWWGLWVFGAVIVFGGLLYLFTYKKRAIELEAEDRAKAAAKGSQSEQTAPPTDSQK